MTGRPAWKWDAIAIGVAAGFAIGWLGLYVPDLFDVGEHPERIDAMIATINGLGVLSSLVCGALAGWFGAPRAVAHGALAAALELALGFTTGVVIGVLRYPDSLGYVADPMFYVAIVPWWIGGFAAAIAAAAIAGHLRTR